MSELVSLARAILERTQTKEADWFQVWRELAALTYGITGDDSRFPLIMGALNKCDDAFQKKDWLAFKQAAEHVRAAVHR